MRQLLLVISFFAVFGGPKAFAASLSNGLVIYAADITQGKFHRIDNKIHKYASTNIWSKFVMPDNYNGSDESAIIENNDGSVTIFFSNLEDLLLAVAKISTKRKIKIASLNIDSHGIPGALWFPADRGVLGSQECGAWFSNVRKKDEEIYNQYYTPFTKYEIIGIKASAQHPAHYACTVGAAEWKAVVLHHTELKQVFDSHSEINLLGSMVGLGKAGEFLAGTIAAALLNDKESIVKTSQSISLGDWSVPEGAIFWNYTNDIQLAHDMLMFLKNKKSRDLSQKGIVRITTSSKGKAVDKFVPEQTYFQFGFSVGSGMYLDLTKLPGINELWEPLLPSPWEVRIPGTNMKAAKLD